jgi:hypothetical protein
MTQQVERVQVDRAIALFGTAQAPPQSIVLEAGPLSVTLENGALRWIRLGDVEVIRGIAFLVRDRNWGTPTAEIADLDIARDADGFRVAFHAQCRTADGVLPWSGEIVASAASGLRFTGTATPPADFVTNRTGFVILHPLERVAGCPVTVTHTDGTLRRTRFPALVDPEQCFFDVYALSHEPVPGIQATIRMEGDAWEMEDHRNWLDASFKTYVRPLALPYPYTIPGGTTVTQSVSLTFEGPPPKAAPRARAQPVEIALGAALPVTLPKIGLRAPVQALQQAEHAAPRLRDVGAQLLAARIDPRLGHGEVEMQRFAALAEALGAALALEYVAPCREDPRVELAAFAAALRRSGAQPESIAVAPAEDRIRGEPGAPPPPLALLGAVYQAARAALPGMRIGGGTFAFFTELNRNWPPLGLIDYVTHMVSSVVHASDDRSMMENLQSFAPIRETVHAFAGDKPYRIVALGLGLEGGVANPDGLRMAMAEADPRHRGLFGAAWALGALAELAARGIEAVTPAALAGPVGLADAEHLYPLYHVVAGMAEGQGRRLCAVTGAVPGRIAALAHETSDGVRLWLANLTDARQVVALRGLASSTACVLDEHSFSVAATAPDFMRRRHKLAGSEIEMGAYGVACIESGR